MASVQITDVLVERTVAKIDRFERRTRENAERQFLEAVPHNGTELYDMLVGPEFVAWASKAPPEMLGLATSFKIGAVGEYNVGLDVPMTASRWLPAGKPAFPGGMLTTGFRCATVNFDPGHEDWTWLGELTEVLKAKREKAYAEKWALRTFTTNVLRNWSSLGPSIRAWPALWDLLDKDDQERQGQRPKGMIGDVPGHLGDADSVRKMTALVARIKLTGVR